MKYPGQLLVGGSEPDCDVKHFLDHPSEMQVAIQYFEWRYCLLIKPLFICLREYIPGIFILPKPANA
jgi:hypothetical protein